MWTQLYVALFYLFFNVLLIGLVPVKSLASTHNIGGVWWCDGYRLPLFKCPILWQIWANHLARITMFVAEDMGTF